MDNQVLVYLAASYAHSGRTGRAQAVAELVRQDSKDFDPKAFVDRLFQLPEQKELLVEGMHKAGLALDNTK